MAGNRGPKEIKKIYIVNDNGVYDRQVLMNISSILSVDMRQLQNADIRVIKQNQGNEAQFYDIHDPRQQKRAEEARKKKEAERKEKLKSEFDFLQDSSQESWKQVFNPTRRSTDDSFAKTKAYGKVKTTIVHYNYVVIMGYPSTGKTAIAMFIANEFNGKTTLRSVNKYKLLHLKTPQEFREQVDPTKFMVIIIEDIFGKHSANLKKVELWQDFLHEMQIIIKTAGGKLKLIITCGTHIYKNVSQFLKRKHLFSKSQIVDISDDVKDMDHSERTDVLRSTSGFLQNKENTNPVGYTHIGYPLSCRLYGIFNSFQNVGRLFFQDPSKYLLQEIDKVKRFDNTIYGILVYTALNNGRLDVRGKELTELDPAEFEKMKKVFSTVGVKVDLLEMWIIQRAAEMLSGVFFTCISKNLYKMMHHRFTEYVLKSFDMLHCNVIVELAVPEIFQELVKTYNYESTYEKNVAISRSSHDLMSRRLIFQILQGNIREACQHQVFTDTQFMGNFLEYLDRMGTMEALYRARDSEHMSLLFWAAWYGRDLLVEGFAKNEALIRMVDDGLGVGEQRTLALLAACYRGGITELEVKKPLYRFKNDPPEKLKPALGVRALLQLNPQVNCSPQMTNAENVLNLEFSWMMKNKAMPLHYAVVGESIDAVMAILEHGPDVNAKTAIGETPLHFAAIHTDPAIAQLLIEKGGEVMVTTDAGKTPLGEAVGHGSVKLAKLLIEKGASVNSVSQDDGPLLHTAVSNCDYEMMELLVEKHIDVNQKGRNGWSALHAALYLGDTRSADFLIEKGASVAVPVYGSIVPLHEAIATSDTEITDILLEGGISVNTTNMNGETPLHLAAKKGNLETIKKLLDLKANLTVTDHSGKQPLNLAASASNREVLEYLLKRSGGTDHPFKQRF
ncbi:uncharacterized protein LOC121375973 [Gigantopelta aegis]|uniref:uncharacterized protein LOC121375973 n=1 Tax=Gigantopelta aegis TaxID=1735272 RepID=UPI001B888802|nr:uncharacterized protein LOC121375973 [Gigantopelta aegis]